VRACVTVATSMRVQLYPSTAQSTQYQTAYYTRTQGGIPGRYPLSTRVPTKYSCTGSRYSSTGNERRSNAAPALLKVVINFKNTRSGVLEKRFKNGWIKRPATLVIPHKARS
jgi:hypothetical protein